MMSDNGIPDFSGLTTEELLNLVAQTQKPSPLRSCQTISRSLQTQPRLGAQSGSMSADLLAQAQQQQQQQQQHHLLALARSMPQFAALVKAVSASEQAAFPPPSSSFADLSQMMPTPSPENLDDSFLSARQAPQARSRQSGIDGGLDLRGLVMQSSSQEAQRGMSQLPLLLESLGERPGTAAEQVLLQYSLFRQNANIAASQGGPNGLARFSEQELEAQQQLAGLQGLITSENSLPPREPEPPKRAAMFDMSSVVEAAARNNALENGDVVTGKDGKACSAKKKSKRPLSAYNIYFKEEHAKIIAQQGKERAEKIARGESLGEDEEDYEYEEDGKKRKRSLSTNQPGKRGKRQVDFENLTKIIGKRWKELPRERAEEYKKRAEQAMEKYRKELFQKIRSSVQDGHS